ATHAALTAPTDVPIRKSGQTSASKRALSIPIWTAPKLPPPEKTNADKPCPPAPFAARDVLIATAGWVPSSGRLFDVAVFQSLLAQVFELHRGIQSVPQPPVGLRPPHLVEHRLELGVQVGRVCLRSVT